MTALAWLYLLAMRQNTSGMVMNDMPGMVMPTIAAWTPTTLALTFAMWWVMMLGMMVPSAAPMVLTFTTLNRSKRARGQTVVPTLIFVLGYLIVWGGFSLSATVAQWSLDRFAMLSPMMATISPVLGGALLILAGLYQFTPLKQACLRNCRSPFAFVLNHWRNGRAGALSYGAGAWRLLPRLLRNVDAAPVRRWGDELALGGCHRGVRVRRKVAAGR